MIYHTWEKHANDYTTDAVVMKRHYLKHGVVKVCGVYTNVGIELTDKEEDIIVCDYLIRWVMQKYVIW